MKHNRNPPPSETPKARRARAAAICGGLVAAGVWMGFAAPGWASLGNDRASIEADRAHLSARSSTVVTSGYTVHVLTLPNGGAVKEFERSDGVVFALAWRGPSRPDLRQLLGSRFNVMQSDIVVRNGRRLRAPLADERSDFVLRSAGHSGAFVGAAYLPQMAPADFSVSALH